jgi:hypothetical protein
MMVKEVSNPPILYGLTVAERKFQDFCQLISLQTRTDAEAQTIRSKF